MRDEAGNNEGAEGFLTTEELAERWRTTSAGILNQRHRGNAPRGHRIGKRVLFKLEDVESFEATRADPPREVA